MQYALVISSCVLGWPSCAQRAPPLEGALASQQAKTNLLSPPFPLELVDHGDKWTIRSDLTVVDPVPVSLISTLTHDQLAKTPAWQQGSEYPPLSPGKAEEIALKMLHKIAGEQRWTQPNISLTPFDVDVTQGSSRRSEIRWFYILHFQLWGRAALEGGLLNIIVLMDGTAIEPQVLEYKVIQRDDYPGLNNPFAMVYAFSWKEQLHLYEEQGWSIDSVKFKTNTFTANGSSSELREALITLKRLQNLSERKSPLTPR